MKASLLRFVLLVFSLGCLRLTAAESRPNIIVILADDMGYSDLGCFGGEIHTPNLDSLAADGVRFTQFYNTARCCPTRASLLTGLYPHQAGVGYMTDLADYSAKVMINEWYSGDLRPDTATLGEAMRANGYRTYAIGKWHVTKNIEPNGPRDNWPLERGFDRYYGVLPGAANYFAPVHLTRDNTRIDPKNDPEYPAKNYYLTDAFSDHAVRFVTEHAKQQAAQPFFMYLAYTAAHWPMQAKPADIARYSGKYDAGYGPIRQARFEKMKQLGLLKPEWALSPQFGDWSAVERKDWEARCMEVYAAEIDCMDQGIGRLIAALKANGQYENTLIVFLQDNGACAETPGRNPPAGKAKKNGGNKGFPTMPGPEDTWIAYGEAWANVSNTPFRLYKHYVHEGGISTPLIAHWPRGITRKGALEPQPGHLIDIMATCVDLAGGKYPTEHAGKPVQPMEGRSLVPAFAGKKIQRDALFWEHEGNRALRVGDWKLVAKGAGGPWELYDLARDRTEMHDLAAAQPARVKEMITTWNRWAERTHAVPWPWKPPYPTTAKPSAQVLEVKKIWDAGGHNAFTDLVRWHDRWWCTFRESEAHVGGDGGVRIITSTDGTAWESAALLKEKDVDLRDPKLTVTPADKLMLNCGGSVYLGTKTIKGKQSRVAFSSDGRTWTVPQRILREGDWLWRVTWHDGVAYGAAYRSGLSPTTAPGEWELALYRSADGITWDRVQTLDVRGKPNETTLRFDANGEMIAMVRREGEGMMGYVGHAAPPYTQWSWSTSNHRFGGQNFLQLPGGTWLVGSRDHTVPPAGSTKGVTTMLAQLSSDGQLTRLATLPSGGDTSYPGLVWQDGVLWMSYYSSHEGKTAIYLAKVKITEGSGEARAAD